jgi:hypothetical protein
MLRDYFPNSEEGSKIYGGLWLVRICFVKNFASRDSN